MTILCLLLQQFFSSFFWNRYMENYYTLLEVPVDASLLKIQVTSYNTYCKYTCIKCNIALCCRLARWRHRRSGSYLGCGSSSTPTLTWLSYWHSSFSTRRCWGSPGSGCWGSSRWRPCHCALKLTCRQWRGRLKVYWNPDNSEDCLNILYQK